METQNLGGVVYFITDGLAIKIGFCTNVSYINKRIKELQTGNPRKLELLYYHPQCTEQDERRIHAFFSKHRIRGEWFSMEPIIRRSRRGGGWPYSVNTVLGRKHPSKRKPKKTGFEWMFL